jgi:hypothetical protein
VKVGSVLQSPIKPAFLLVMAEAKSVVIDTTIL